MARMFAWAPVVLAALVVGVAPSLARQPEAPALDRVTLISGETLAGVVSSRTDEVVTLVHPLLGVLEIPTDRIASVATVEAAVEGEPAPEAAEAPSDEPVAAAADAVIEEKPAVQWSGQFELGASGAQGNSESSSFHAGFSAQRVAKLSELSINTTYRLATDDGNTTTNRFFNRLRYEWRPKEQTRWSLFAQTSQELDEFKDYDFRLSGAGGLSYLFIDRERTRLKGYGGFGAAREFGGSDTDVMPFGLLGAEASHKLNSRVALTAAGEYEPRFDDFGEFRARARASMDVDLTNGGDLKLRLGVENEYDSDPGDAKKNDFYYFASIVLAF